MISDATKVLIVDDFSLARVMLSESLKVLGIKDLVEAKNGREALALLEESFQQNKPFSLVFLDWAMPEMDGYEVLKACRADEKFSKLPIIMVTAEEDRSSVLKAIAAGADSYIKKPISSDILSKKIEEMNQKFSSRKET